MKILLSLFMLLTTLNSCDSSKKAMENSKKMEDSLSGTYYITQLGDTDVSSNKITITFDTTTNKVTGFAGCNRFFGNYLLENNTITFSQIGASKKLCPGSASVSERHFLKALNTVNTFSIKDNILTFLDQETTLITATTSQVSSQKSAKTNTDIDYKTVVKYTTNSKLTYDFVSISKTNVFISQDKNLIEVDKFHTEQKDWKEINQLIDKIDIEAIQDLIPPSTNHQLDGALHASLAIIVGDVEYKTPTFDHGNPPEVILALVNKVLSIKENTIKK
ncbi:META domain-containing protein [Winogradskyella eckloniae]|uniref:META domain-containing protein n=1 Tax=Winogradskyella eckloniae TaxID=1089306 RepID=UPI001565A295|nr:META domain-containing protein [Winogradskyella eckloniae]NRD18741.1 META domain-containing protein [Winogradskyella eckloniae]